MARTFTSELTVSLIDRVTGVSKKVGGSLRDLGRTIDRANSQSPTFMTRVDAALTRSQASLERARGGILDAAAAFYTLKSAIAGPVKEATAFESAMADVRKVVDFPTPAAFKQFQADLLDLSTTVPLTVNGLAEIAAAAGQAGIAGKDLTQFTETAAKVGTAFDITADEAGTAMAKMMTGLGLSIDQVTLLADSMNHLSNAQASSAAEILDVVRRAGAQGKQFGFTAEQTAAFASAMIAAGAQSDVAATSFMNMGRALTRGASATKRQRGAMEKLGLDTEDVAKRMQSDAAGTTIEVMERLAKLPAHMRAAVSTDLFGDEARALGPLLTNLDLTRDSLEMVADQSKYAGSAFKEFEVRNATFGNKMSIFNNRLTALKITIGNALIPVLSDLMDKLAPVVDRISGWIDANPALTAGVLSATAALIAFKGAVAGLRFVGLLGATGALSLLSTAMHAVGRASGGMVGAARASIGLQTALAGMSGEKIGLFGRLSAGLRGLTGAIPGVAAAKAVITGLVAAIGGISAPVWLAIAAAVAAVGAAWRYWDRISAIVTGVAQAVGQVLPSMDQVRSRFPLVAAALERAGGAFRRVGADIQWLVDKVKAIGSGLFSREILTEAEKGQITERARKLTSDLLAFFAALPGRLFEVGSQMLQSLWDGMQAKAEQVKAWAREVAAEISSSFQIESSIRKGSVLDRAGNAAKGRGFVPTPVDGARAEGGPIRAGRSYLVGEERAEVITPRRDGYVHPSVEDWMGAGRGGGGGGGVSISGVTINAPMSFPGATAADADRIADRVMDRLRRETNAALRGAYADLGVA